MMHLGDKTLNPQYLINRATAVGLSINEVQKRARVGSSFFWRWKTGRIAPRAATIERIEQVLQEVENG